MCYEPTARTPLPPIAGVMNGIVSHPDAPHPFFDRTEAAHAEASDDDAWRRVLAFIRPSMGS
jgi:dienelactone hydrolase